MSKLFLAVLICGIKANIPQTFPFSNHLVTVDLDVPIIMKP